MLIVKLFIPENVYYSKSSGKLYGDIVEKEQNISLLIVADGGSNTHKCVGRIGKKNLESENCCAKILAHFRVVREHPNIILESITGTEELVTSVQIILYDKKGFCYLSENEDEQLLIDENSDIFDLVRCLAVTDSKAENRSAIMQFFTKCFSFSQYFLWLWWLLSKLLSLVESTSVVRHFAEWRNYLRKHHKSRGKYWTIAFDVAAGMSIIIWLRYLGEPGHYMMSFTESIVDKVRHLLHALKGSPVGLKLNVQLNNFFLDCFIYHVNLWTTFLVRISPIINYLFIPLAVLGLFGLSFQLAMLSDLVVIINLHAHCFYIYAALLYQMEIVGMRGLWRVVLGRRKNILKDRVESHEYINRQLYLATMFFAALLFLLPTVLVYYIVFASLRFGLYCITYLLLIMRQKILVFPVYSIIRWIFGRYVNGDNIELTFLDIKQSVVQNFKPKVSVIFIKPKPSVPWRDKMMHIKDDDCKYRPASLRRFLSGLLRGEMVGFINPK